MDESRRESPSRYRDLQFSGGAYVSGVCVDTKRTRTRTKTMNGKGDTPRPVDFQKYRENHDRIFGKKKPESKADEKKNNKIRK